MDTDWWGWCDVESVGYDKSRVTRLVPGSVNITDTTLTFKATTDTMAQELPGFGFGFGFWVF